MGIRSLVSCCGGVVAGAAGAGGQPPASQRSGPARGAALTAGFGAGPGRRAGLPQAPAQRLSPQPLRLLRPPSSQPVPCRRRRAGLCRVNFRRRHDGKLVDEVLTVELREFVHVRHRDALGRTRIHAQAAVAALCDVNVETRHIQTLLCSHRCQAEIHIRRGFDRSQS